MCVRVPGMGGLAYALPSLEDKDPLPDSRGSALSLWLRVASTAELLWLGVPGNYLSNEILYLTHD